MAVRHASRAPDAVASARALANDLERGMAEGLEDAED